MPVTSFVANHVPHSFFSQVGAAIDESEMQDLFHASDIDGTGQIDYEQFIAAMLDSNRVARRKEAVSAVCVVSWDTCVFCCSFT